MSFGENDLKLWRLEVGLRSGTISTVVNQVEKRNADGKVELNDKKQFWNDRFEANVKSNEMDKHMIESFAAIDQPPLSSPTISMLSIQLKLQNC